MSYKLSGAVFTAAVSSCHLDSHWQKQNLPGPTVRVSCLCAITDSSSPVQNGLFAEAGLQHTLLISCHLVYLKSSTSFFGDHLRDGLDASIESDLTTLWPVGCEGAFDSPPSSSVVSQERRCYPHQADAYGVRQRTVVARMARMHRGGDRASRTRGFCSPSIPRSSPAQNEDGMSPRHPVLWRV